MVEFLMYFGVVWVAIVIGAIVLFVVESLLAGLVAGVAALGGLTYLIKNRNEGETATEAPLEPVAEQAAPFTEKVTEMLELLATDFILGIAALVVFAFIVFAAESEQLFSGIAAFVAFVVAVEVLPSEVEPLTWVKENIVWFLAYAIVFVAVGIGYTFYKWRQYCVRNADTEGLEKWVQSHKDKTLDDAEEYYSNPRHFKLHPLNNIYRLSNWVFLWPWSLFWTVLHDPIKALWNYLYSLFGGLWLKMAVNASQSKK